MELTKIEIKDRIGYITLNRPEKRNALSYDFVGELKDAFAQLKEDDSAKVIVLRAEGKAFCAGADLAYIQGLQGNTFEENLEDSNHLKELFYEIYTYPKVVIAEIQGHALAGGCGLATVCDFSYTVPHAKFGYTEVKIGFIPAIVKVFLLRKIGEGKSKELLLSGKLYEAKDALKMGLVNEVVEAEKLSGTVYDFAQQLIQNNSGQSMAFTKQMIAEVQEKGLEEGLQYAAEQNAKARASEDCKKGIAAFLNKKTPSW
ncbi:enoyl-CoA hydratase-related protein [Marivirga harenae]|uniref:enoyl-CoA hydratase/isomerase family protein n=1 Tax=Marivirga harenae TaxID=2010992 RepID=UPI0026E0B65C|nr:enoyl-CoA hydratase-related protein [Marivirga harenae]WKV12164.1 enoyl-CoA hydratase-related protein [Marivirga harenae]|tara:strand:- start:295739 stop:296512 length:774 start_codon:yes stop_codon:yes gene_type:complete